MPDNYDPSEQEKNGNEMTDANQTLDNLKNIEAEAESEGSAAEAKLNEARAQAQAKINKLSQKAKEFKDKQNKHISDLFKQQTGKTVTPEEVNNGIGKFSFEIETGDETQDAMNYVLKNRLGPLLNNHDVQNDAKNTSKWEFVKKYGPKFLKGLKYGMVFGFIGNMIAGAVYELIQFKKQPLKEIAQGSTGCYQEINDPNLGYIYYVGPCNCGFNLESTGTCPVVDISNIKPKTIPFCSSSNFSNFLQPCDYTTQACKSIKSGGTCDSSCQNDSCKKNPNAIQCKWLDDKDKRVTGTFAICGNPSNMLTKMMVLSDNADSWVPQPTPPITIIITILGIIGIIITVLWYIIFLIRQERKMGKK
jgi:hypothetical protein